MTNLNVVAITGKLAEDSEYIQTSETKGLLKMKVIVCKDIRQNEVKVSLAKYFEVVFFDEIGKTLSQYLCKGKVVAISGELDQYVYEDSEGNKKHKVKIIAHRIEMIGRTENE